MQSSFFRPQAAAKSICAGRHGSCEPKTALGGHRVTLVPRERLQALTCEHDRHSASSIQLVARELLQSVSHRSNLGRSILPTFSRWGVPGDRIVDPLGHPNLVANLFEEVTPRMIGTDVGIINAEFTNPSSEMGARGGCTRTRWPQRITTHLLWCLVIVERASDR